AVEVAATHPFLGQHVMAALIRRVGERWKRAAVLWRWGAAFASGTSGEGAVAEVTWSSAAEREFGGVLRVAVWGEGAVDFRNSIAQTVRDLPGFPPDATFRRCGDGDGGAIIEDDAPVIVSPPGHEGASPRIEE